NSRIINTGSSLHKSGRPEFDFKHPWKYSAMKAYSTSKLMITMFSYSLAERFSGTGISVSVVEPGFVATNLGRNSGSGLLSASFRLMRPFQISANEAAKTPVYLASSADSLEINGKCFSRMKPVQTSQISHDKKKQDELWLQTSEALGLPNDV
ncbi:short-chain dehydrogenase/reductase SDR, partial [mine drainage metagenome]